MESRQWRRVSQVFLWSNINFASTQVLGDYIIFRNADQRTQTLLKTKQDRVCNGIYRSFAEELNTESKRVEMESQDRKQCDTENQNDSEVNDMTAVLVDEDESHPITALRIRDFEVPSALTARLRKRRDNAEVLVNSFEGLQDAEEVTS